MPGIAVTLLGPFQIILDNVVISGLDNSKAGALLAYLTFEAGEAHRRESLAALLWPESTEKDARNSLRQTLFKLRRLLASSFESVHPLLQITHETIRLNPSAQVWVDVQEFRALLAACQQHPHESMETCEPCVQRLIRAEALYQGDLLTNVSVADSPDYDLWAEVKREWIRYQYQGVLYYLARYYELCGDYDSAYRYAWRQVEIDPLREEAHRQLMRVLALSGRRGAALSQFEACRKVLALELDLDPEQETMTLFEAIRAGQTPLPNAGKSLNRRSPRPLRRLPLALTPMLGREIELMQVTARLLEPTMRLLSITGPGGAGKTRLAAEAASRVANAFADGVQFISVPDGLGLGTKPDRLADHDASLFPLLAEAINLGSNEADPRSEVLAALRGQHMLLILDGVEHSSGTTSTVLDLLRQVPNLTLLLTTRQRLNLQAEFVVRLAGLATAPLQGASSEGSHPAAVQLFIERVSRIRSDLRLDSEEVRAISRVCQFVGGLPLLIELAAARAERFSIHEIADAVERDIDFLTVGMHDLPERHRSLRALLEPSWRLLTEDEKTLFASLSLFFDAFTEYEAAAIIGASPTNLHHLVEASLLRRIGPGTYVLDGVTRQFGAVKLDERIRAGMIDIAGLRQRLRSERGTY